MEEIVLTELKLVEELCNARDCGGEGWERAAEAWQHDKRFITEYGKLVTSEYGEYLKGKNLDEIPEGVMRSTTVWRDLGGAWPFILDEIRTSPREYQKIIIIAIDRYRVAARKLLTGITTDRHRVALRELLRRIFIDVDSAEPITGDRVQTIKQLVGNVRANEQRFIRLKGSELLGVDDIPAIQTGINPDGKTFNILSVYNFLRILFPRQNWRERLLCSRRYKI